MGHNLSFRSPNGLIQKPKFVYISRTTNFILWPSPDSVVIGSKNSSQGTSQISSQILTLALISWARFGLLHAWLADTYGQDWVLELDLWWWISTLWDAYCDAPKFWGSKPPPKLGSPKTTLPTNINFLIYTIIMLCKIRHYTLWVFNTNIVSYMLRQYLQLNYSDAL